VGRLVFLKFSRLVCRFVCRLGGGLVCRISDRGICG
jgi:hypothetical protein